MIGMRKMLSTSQGSAESKTPMVVTIIILLILGFLSYKFIPVKIRSMRFVDDIQRILNIDYAREYKDLARGGFNEYTMREKIIESAKRFNIPIKDPDKQINVQWPENRIFTADVSYVEEVKLPIIGPYEWKFHVYVEQDPLANKANVTRKE